MSPLLSIALGASLIVLGAAYGIGKIGAEAMKSIGRQPAAADKIKDTMLLPCVLVEGATMFSLVILLVVAFV